MKWFRWIGLVVFVVLVGGGALVTWLFLDDFVEGLIENEGSELVGAQVDLESVEIQLWPTKLALNGLAVTNPKQTSHNIFQTQQVEFELDSAQLLMDKFIVDEMSVLGLELSTLRASDGALPGAKAAEGSAETAAEEDSFKFPELDVPDVKEVVKEDELITVQRARKLQKTLDEKEAHWKKRVASLPDKKKFEGYKARIKKLESAKSIKDRLKAVKELDKIRKEIKNDHRAIKTARADLKKDVAAIKQQVKALKAAPKEDVDRILADLGLTEGGLDGLAKALFGDQVTGWIKQSLSWYELVKPYISDDEASDAASGEETKTDDRGQEIAFKEYEPLPDFLIRLINISGAQVADSGEQFNYVGKMTDITDGQDIINRPTEISLRGESDRQTSFEFHATLDHRNPEAEKDTMTLQVDQFNVENWSLSRGSLPLELAEAKLNLNANADYADSKLASVVVAKFSQAKMQTANREGLSEVKLAVVNGLENAEEFSVTVKANGELLKPKISVSSDITKPIKESIKGLVANKKTELKADIEAEVKSKLDEQMKGLNEKLAKFEDMDKKISGKDRDFSSL